MTLGIEQEIARRTTLEADVRRRWRTYPNRRVTVDAVSRLREDRDWRVGAAVLHELSSATQLRLEYERELRASTDPRRKYDAHRFGLSVRQRLFTWTRARRESS